MHISIQRKTSMVGQPKQMPTTIPSNGPPSAQQLERRPIVQLHSQTSSNPQLPQATQAMPLSLSTNQKRRATPTHRLTVATHSATSITYNPKSSLSKTSRSTRHHWTTSQPLNHRRRSPVLPYLNLLTFLSINRTMPTTRRKHSTTSSTQHRFNDFQQTLKALTCSPVLID